MLDMLRQDPVGDHTSMPHTGDLLIWAWALVRVLP